MMVGSAWAHGEAPPGADTPLLFVLDPLVLAILAIAALLYWKGSARLGARETSFAAGLIGVFLALVWPLETLGERLFSAHMVQHLLLMNIAAPLFVLGTPLPAMFRAIPNGWRRALGALLKQRAWRLCWRTLSGLTVATVLQQSILWVWHTPGGIAAALEINAMHIVMHASLLAAALLFWRAVLQPGVQHTWAPIAALAVTLKITGLVCIVLLLHPDAIYAAYGDSARAFGLTPAEDEQLGWGLMMVVGGGSYLVAALALTALAFNRLEHAYPENHGVGRTIADVDLPSPDAEGVENRS